MRFMAWCVVGITGSFFLSGCDNVRESIGLHKEGPDEFSEAPVNRDLVLPQDFQVLPSPKGEAPFTPQGKTVPSNPLKTAGEKALIQSVEAQTSQRNS